MKKRLSIAFICALVGSCITAPVSCSYVGYMRAQSTCDETAIGSSIDDFRARAKRKMDHVFEVPDERRRQRDDDASSLQDEGQDRGKKKGSVSSMAVGFVFLRYFCNVDYEDGKVTSKRLTSLD